MFADSSRMAAMFTCCLGCCGDGGSGHIPLKEMPTVQLDTHHMGKWTLSLFYILYKQSRPTDNVYDVMV